MRNAPSATSLPRAPREDGSARFRHYAITMSARTACFLLMIFVTPYGWYTWLFAIGAVVLPYIAVVIANAGRDSIPREAERPQTSLPSNSSSSPSGTEATVITIAENPPS